MKGYLLRSVVDTLLASCKVHVEGVERLQAALKKGPTVVLLWHNRVLPMGSILHHYSREAQYAAVMSRSRDADWLAAYVETYRNIRPLRVGHLARAAGLREMIRLLEEGKMLVVTPDGPRGPRYQVKPGVWAAAKKVGASVVPFGWTSTKYWSLGTWDGFMIPKPFSRVQASFGEAIMLPNDLSQEDACQQLAQALKGLETR